MGKSAKHLTPPPSPTTWCPTAPPAGAAIDGVKRDLTAAEKEMQKALAEVREKLAPLESQQPPMKPTPES